MTIKHVLILVLSFIGLFLLLRSHRGEQAELLEQNYTRIAEANKTLLERLKTIEADMSTMSDSLEYWKGRKEKTIIIRETIREESGKKIAEGLRKSEKEADSLLNDRFPTRKDNYIFVLKADSIGLEHRSLEEIYSHQQKELMSANSLISSLNEKLVLKDEQLELKDEVTGLKDIEIKALKKQRFDYALKGFVIGAGVGAAAILLAK